MMNPWDREQLWREAPGGDSGSSAGSGWVWLIAVIVAVVAIAVYARSNGNTMVLVPIAISVFFMFMFLINHRREARRLESTRRMRRIEEAARRAQAEPMGMQLPSPARDDAALRKVFDRFDLKVIEHGRSNKIDPKQLSSLLEMARDFVDTPHATQLMRGKDLTELDRHLDAALERALLQFDVANNRSGDEKRATHYYGDDLPF